MEQKKQVKLKAEGMKNFLKHIIQNNRYLATTGKKAAAVEVIGESGYGKTSIVLQLAQELNLDYVKLNLAQIEELGDLVGFPIRQFKLSIHRESHQPELENEEKFEWVDEHAIDEYLKMGYKLTGEKRMSYCPPEWIADKKKGGILLLDDWNR